ncbi:HAMP domain-containing sensor histidine kinase [Alteromonas sp. 14N.309.X.WAT.G.H12]|uniref:sensor histidine kinase n=1 Tax=Alteromonas sp. 14N.309.X.WAT.G.H12 TaxID=3120824 RepID=UPI002FD49ADA
MSAKRPRLVKQLYLVFATLALGFTLLIWSVPVFVEDQMEVISLHHWLDTEAKGYTRSLAQGGPVMYPDSAEFEIYWQYKEKPDWLNAYTVPGFYEHQLGSDDRHFLVRNMPDDSGLFYVVFKDQADDYLDDYEDKLQWFVSITVLVIMVLMLLVSIYLGRFFARPLEQMQAKVRYMAPDEPDFTVNSRYYEINSIEQAMLDSKHRIGQYFQREQDFSRFASHEIRTPLMVLQGSAELLHKTSGFSELQRKALNRILVAGEDIRLLTETFLLLGKEEIESQFYKSVSLLKNIQATLQTQQRLNQNSLIEVKLNVHTDITIHAPESFVVITLQNIIKNAFSYASTYIAIDMDSHCLKVSNDYLKADQRSGYGYGLVILERICEKLGWGLDITVHESEFLVAVQFPKQ